MNNRVISISAWFGLAALIFSLLSTPLRIPFVIPFLFTVISVLFVFIPFYFFAPNKRLDGFYINPGLRKAQGICMYFVAVAPIFGRLHLPYASMLTYLSYAGLAFLVLSLTRLKSIHIHQPQVITLIVFIVFSGLTKPIGTLSKKASNETILELHDESTTLYNTYIENFNKLQNPDSLDRFKQELGIINFISKLEVELIAEVEGIPLSIADTLSFENIGDIFNFDISNEMMFNNHQENGSPKTPLATDLRNTIQFYLNTHQKKYKQVLFDFNPKEINGRTVTWEEDQFSHLPIGETIVKLELFKLFIANELLIKSRTLNDLENPELFALRRDQYVQLYKASVQDLDQSYEKVKANRIAFLTLMSMIYIVITLLFFIPSFPLSRAWKIRLLLFFLVIVFEFILLLTDLYLGLFSQNVSVLLGVNVLLALGLVTVDNFLRSNFLSWYEESSEKDPHL